MDSRVTSPTWGPPPPCKQGPKCNDFPLNLYCDASYVNTLGRLFIKQNLS